MNYAISASLIFMGMRLLNQAAMGDAEAAAQYAALEAFMISKHQPGATPITPEEANEWVTKTHEAVDSFHDRLARLQAFLAQ